MYNTNVATSYANGTIIHMDANDALHFIVGLSITVINMVRDAIEEENKFGDKVTKSCDHDVMHLIEYYTDGIPEAWHSNILQTNADILLKFVQDAVLNDTSKGLYLFYNRSQRDAHPYDLVVKALEDVHQYYMTYGVDHYKRDNTKHFNRYNEDFIKLMNRK